MKRFENRVVAITGGGSGMGKISSIRFAQEGAAIAVVDINSKTAQATADEIIASGGKAKAYAMDITDEKRKISSLNCSHFGGPMLFTLCH